MSSTQMLLPTTDRKVWSKLSKMPIISVQCVRTGQWIKHGGADLERDVGNAFSEELQAAPGALMQEAQGHIKGGPAPHLQAACPPQHMRGRLCGLQHVMGAHPGGQQTLMCVTPAYSPAASRIDQYPTCLMLCLAEKVFAAFTIHVLET